MAADYDPNLYARSFADVYDSWYGDLDDPSLIVSAFADRLRTSARIVEFGSGTGRLATPLANAGFAVVGVDISPEMLTEAAPGSERIAADMAAVPLRSGCADAVLIAYNTVFNLMTERAQRACLAETARLLRPGGALAIEAFIAPPASTEPGGGEYGVTVNPHPSGPGTVAIVTERTEQDPNLITGVHVERLASLTRLRPWQLRYLSPPEFDRLADEHGLTCTDRHADWVGSVFDERGSRHVSWYEHNSTGAPYD